MEPRQVAQSLMNYYLKGNTDKMNIKYVDDFEDNEITIQVLLTIYNEMHNIWYEHPHLNEKWFLEVIHKSFASLGFKLNIIDPTDVITIDGIRPDEIIHYASITPDGSLLLNQFHPLNIANLITKEGCDMPESYRDLFTNPLRLPYIVALHKYSNMHVDIVSFGVDTR